jgi:hypothetical protein
MVFYFDIICDDLDFSVAKLVEFGHMFRDWYQNGTTQYQQCLRFSVRVKL